MNKDVLFDLKQSSSGSDSELEKSSSTGLESA